MQTRKRRLISVKRFIWLGAALACLQSIVYMHELEPRSLFIAFHLEIDSAIPFQTMKRTFPWVDQVDVIILDDSSPSPSSPSNDPDGVGGSGSGNEQNKNITIDLPPKETKYEVATFRTAQMYQDYMKQIPIPTLRGSVIPYDSWVGLGNSLKKLYGQPLNYLSNVLLKKWDKARIGCEDEDKPLDDPYSSL